jgi:hypothetical protein
LPDPDKVAAFAADLARSDPDVALLISDVKKLDHLQNDGGWQTLLNRIIEQRGRFMIGIARGLMAGKFPDREELAYRRGYFQGALDTVQTPLKVAESLEQAAIAAYRKAVREEAEGEEAPYV